MNESKSKILKYEHVGYRNYKKNACGFWRSWYHKSITPSGVTNGGEGTSGFNVRGGAADQYLILLDEANVFNSSHLFGFFSVFNPDAIKNLKLYKGGIPARYGGRVSSVLDIYQREGNKNEFHGSGGIGSISSRLLLEGPIKKEKDLF